MERVFQRRHYRRLLTTPRSGKFIFSLNRSRFAPTARTFGCFCPSAFANNL